MMASLVSCGRRLWRRAARVFVAVVVAVGVCVVRVHVAFADHPAPGHQGRHHRRGDPQTAFRHLLPVSGCCNGANTVKPR